MYDNLSIEQLGLNPAMLNAVAKPQQTPGNSMLQQMIMMQMQKQAQLQEINDKYTAAIRGASMEGNPDKKRQLIAEAEQLGMTVNVPEADFGEKIGTLGLSILDNLLLGIPDIATGGKFTGLADKGNRGSETFGQIGDFIGMAASFFPMMKAMSLASKSFQAAKSLGFGQQVRSGVGGFLRQYPKAFFGGEAKVLTGKAFEKTKGLEWLNNEIGSIRKLKTSIQTNPKGFGIQNETDLSKIVSELDDMESSIMNSIKKGDSYTKNEVKLWHKFGEEKYSKEFYDRVDKMAENGGYFMNDNKKKILAIIDNDPELSAIYNGIGKGTSTVSALGKNASKRYYMLDDIEKAMQSVVNNEDFVMTKWDKVGKVNQATDYIIKGVDRSKIATAEELLEVNKNTIKEYLLNKRIISTGSSDPSKAVRVVGGEVKIDAFGDISAKKIVSAENESRQVKKTAEIAAKKTTQDVSSEEVSEEIALSAASPVQGKASNISTKEELNEFVKKDPDRAARILSELMKEDKNIRIIDNAVKYKNFTEVIPKKVVNGKKVNVFSGTGTGKERDIILTEEQKRILLKALKKKNK